MVAETAVEDFKLCLQSFKLSEEKLAEQGLILDKILAVKSEEGDTPEAIKLYGLLDTLTGSLLKLTVSVAKEVKNELHASQEKLS